MFKNQQKRASVLIISSFFLANLFILLLLQSLQAQSASSINLSGSQKLVDQTVAHPGDRLQYTIIISNSSPFSVAASFIDPLPTGLMLESGSLTATMATTLTAAAQSIFWADTIAGHNVVTVSFAAQISSSLAVGESVVNTAVLTGTGQAIILTATTELIPHQLYLPFIAHPLTALTLQPIQLTCNSDSWTVNWDSPDLGVMYELQEAHDAAFTNPTSYNIVSPTQVINHPPSTDNLYHYRVRSLANAAISPWSNSLTVVGNYLDDFADPASGWSVSDSSNATFSYNSNSYLIVSKKSGFLFTSLSPDVSRDSYIVEADVHWQPGSTTNGIYGLIFGANNDGSKLYFLAVYAHTQEYWLFYFDSTKPTADRLQPVFPNRLSNPAINPGQMNNHLQIKRVGTNIEVTINGTTLGTWTDNAQTGSSRAGLIMTANPSNPQSAALFDNFRLRYCDGNTAVLNENLRQTAVSSRPVPILTSTLFHATP